MVVRTILLVTVWLLTASSVAVAQQLRIYHIDVGQADSTLFVSPAGNTLLVDSGKNGAGAEIRAAMQTAGVSRIDHFVLTHYHEDHMGGIDDLGVAPAIPIGAAHDRGDKSFLKKKKLGEPTYKDYQTAVGTSADHITRGETIALDPLMTVTCVASGGVVLGEQDHEPGNDENDMSVGLLIQFGAFRYFIGGDMRETTEGKIAARDLAMDVDVYQANHHGSETSSELSFMQDLSPSVIIISNGNHGGYKHPRQHTLNTYAGLDPVPVVYQTNKYLKGGTGGNVPDAFIADLVSDGPEGTILVTVDADTENFAVSFGATSTSFPVKAVMGDDTAEISIESLLPNPSGVERDVEAATIRNNGSTSVDLSGWNLRELNGRIWTLTSLGTIESETSETILRARMPMALNNGGDTVELINPEGAVVQTVTYGAAGEDEQCRVQPDGSMPCGP